MGFGVLSLLDALCRRMFTSAGLRPGSATVDATNDTTIHYWAHSSLLQPPPSGSEQRPPPPVAAGGGADPRVRAAGPDVAVGGAGRTLVAPLPPGGAVAALLRRVRHARARAVRRLARGGHRLRRPRGVPPRPAAGAAAARRRRPRPRRQGGAVRLGRVQWRRGRPRAGGQGRRGGGGGAAGARRLMAVRALRRLMAVCAHRSFKYVPECLLRDMLRKYFADQREEKIALIKGITTGEGFELAPLPQEVVIIWGEFDQIFPVDKAHMMKEKLGEKATVKVIPNTGHLPQQEDPKLFNQILLDFLLHPSASASNGSHGAK